MKALVWVHSQPDALFCPQESIPWHMSWDKESKERIPFYRGHNPTESVSTSIPLASLTRIPPYSECSHFWVKACGVKLFWKDENKCLFTPQKRALGRPQNTTKVQLGEPMSLVGSLAKTCNSERLFTGTEMTQKQLHP